ncbi:MAG: peptide chain release factor N(5)-glutamine methyltransferase [Salinivirgaceae bacterium]|jgi:release factor glutamine methyltransferase|nr:peptide chain release factor N(5)-glutamine methyltransferase [Salinivirgaceae bacterium]
MMALEGIFLDFRKTLAATLGQNEADAMFFVVLEFLTGMNRTQFFIDRKQEVSADVKDQFQKILKRLSRNEPLQYVIGEAWFYGRRFVVDKNVLIPRPETEEIIGLVKRVCKPEARIIDLGTGSGCIAVTLALECDNVSVTALDVSDGALQVAKQNARNCNVPLNFLQLDMLSPVAIHVQQFDIIVSNPPYVTEGEKVQMNPNVLDHEPELALFVPNDNPLRFYSGIFMLAQKSLSVNGWLIVEINEKYGKQTADLFSLCFENVEIIKDINNKDRFVMAQKKSR